MTKSEILLEAGTNELEILEFYIEDQVSKPELHEMSKRAIALIKAVTPAVTVNV